MPHLCFTRSRFSFFLTSNLVIMIRFRTGIRIIGFWIIIRNIGQYFSTFRSTFFWCRRGDLQEIKTIGTFRIYIIAKYCVYKNNKCLTFVLRVADLVFLLGRTLKSGSDFVLESELRSSDATPFFSRLSFFVAEEETYKRIRQCSYLEITSMRKTEFTKTINDSPFVYE